MPKKIRKVTGLVEGFPVDVKPGAKGITIAIPEIGSNVQEVRVRFRYKGKEYETTAFDQFAEGTKSTK